MSRLASIYVWLFVGAVFIAVNIWVLNSFESKSLYAEEKNPSQVNKVLREALVLSRKLQESKQNFGKETLKLARDPFCLIPLHKKSGKVKYSHEKKFFKTPAVALQLPSIDGILTIRKLDGTRVRYLLIKGKVVKLGESIDGFKIVNVDHDTIMLEAAGKRFAVTLSEPSHGFVGKGAPGSEHPKGEGALAMR